MPLTGAFSFLDKVRVGESGKTISQERKAAARADLASQRGRGHFTKADQKYEKATGKDSPRRT